MIMVYSQRGLRESLEELVRDDYYHKAQIHNQTLVDPQDYILQCNECGMVDGDHIEDTCKVHFIEDFLDSNSLALSQIEARQAKQLAAGGRQGRMARKKF
jgi:hypothetical protein